MTLASIAIIKPQKGLYEAFDFFQIVFCLLPKQTLLVGSISVGNGGR